MFKKITLTVLCFVTLAAVITFIGVTQQAYIAHVQENPVEWTDHWNVFGRITASLFVLTFGLLLPMVLWMLLLAYTAHVWETE